MPVFLQRMFSGLLLNRMLPQFFAGALYFVCVTKAAAYDVAIIQSTETHGYAKTIAAFAKACALSTQTYSIEGNLKVGEDLLKRIESAGKPSLYFTLGAKATFLVKQREKIVPILFANVINHTAYDLEQANVAGISLDVPMAAVLLQLKMIAPNASRVLLVHNERYHGSVREAIEREAKVMGLTSISVSTQPTKDLEERLRAILHPMDVLLVLPDQNLSVGDSFGSLVQVAREKRAVLFSFAEEMVYAGALAAISPDFAAIGTQAATIAEDLIKARKSITDLGVVEPIGTLLSLNLGTANGVGISLPGFVLNHADNIVDNR